MARSDAFNEPGRFTAFTGYEWSSIGSRPGVFGNLYRVVIFRDDKEITGQITPYSAYDSLNPEDQLVWLQQYEADTGGEVIAIPHNPNLSNGEMFAMTTIAGEPITAEWAVIRSRYEPLAEVTQLKGDSESHPLLSPSDEFADFETWNSWSGYYDNWEGHTCCEDRLLPG